MRLVRKNTNRDILTQTASCNIYLSVTNVCIYSQFYDKILLSSTPIGCDIKNRRSKRTLLSDRSACSKSISNPYIFFLSF